MKRVRVIIAGGREFNDYQFLWYRCNIALASVPSSDIEIVSGGAAGADSLGERYAEARSIPVVRFPADWETHGKAAGHIRNKQMGDYATHLIAFWDGKSRGTKGMIDYAKQIGLGVRVFSYSHAS